MEESPRTDINWSRLRCFAGPCTELGKMLLDARKDESHVPRFVDHLEGLIVDQFVYCEGTFYVIPELAAFDLHNDESKFAVYTFIGSVAATSGIFRDLVSEEVLRKFDTSLAETEARLLDHILAVKVDLPNTDSLAVAAVGLSGHRVGKLVMSNLLPYGEVQTLARCQQCGDIFYVFFSDRAIYSEYDRESVEGSIQFRSPLEPPIMTDISPRSGNSWNCLAPELSRLARVESDPELKPHLTCAARLADIGIAKDQLSGPVFSVLGSILQWKGYRAAARRYFLTNNHVTCPHCENKEIFANIWTGQYS